MYYGLIMLAVVMFGGCFALNDVYRSRRGSGFAVSLQYTLLSSAAGFAVLFAANGFTLRFTPFTVVMALAWAANSMLFSYFGFKALGYINLSLYSVFSMLGGMMLPFLQGILFYGESVTAAKVICFLLLCAALALTVRKGKAKKGTPFYLGIFVLNGMSGVITKLFTASNLEKASATDYSVWAALCGVFLSAVLLLLVSRREKPDKLTLPVAALISANGVINKVANLLLVMALAHVDASVQYPMVTGGVMIVSTLLCFFGRNKPSRREIASVLVAFAGLLLLFLLPV